MVYSTQQSNQSSTLESRAVTGVRAEAEMKADSGTNVGR